MAKEDFCFTYYDGDAARDKAHMNRLERGAYDDLISAQRKRGHLSLNDIKKVLSSDFEKCWNSMEWILLTDDEGKFYIEWVDKSLEKMRRQSEKQRENAEKRWKKEDATVMPPHTNGINSGMPLEDGDEDGDGIEDEKENLGKSENPLNEKLLIPEMLQTFKNFNSSYPTDIHRDYKPLQHIAKFICDAQKIPYNPRDQACIQLVFSSWEVISEFISKDQFFKTYNLILIEKHIQSIVQKIFHGQSTGNNAKTGSGKVTGQQLNKAFDDFYSQKKSG